MASISKSMKSATKVVNKNIGGLFSNKYFLYFMLFLAITSVLGYLQAQNFNALLFFILVAFLTYYFTKNMSIVLFSSIVATALYNSMARNIKEGMTPKNDDGEEGMGQEEEDEEQTLVVDLEGLEVRLLRLEAPADGVGHLLVQQVLRKRVHRVVRVRVRRVAVEVVAWERERG